MQLGEIGQKLARAESLIQTGIGGEEANIMLGCLRIPPYIGAVDDDSAGGRLHQAGKNAKRGRFAGSIRTQQAVYLTGINMKADAVESAFLRSADRGESFDESLDLNHAHAITPAGEV